jgi:hypothetical protein
MQINEHSKGQKSHEHISRFRESLYPIKVNLEEIRNRRNIIQYNKDMYDKRIANIILDEEKTEIISSKVRKETRVSTLTTLIQYSTRIVGQSNKARERNKRDTNREAKTIAICK